MVWPGSPIAAVRVRGLRHPPYVVWGKMDRTGVPSAPVDTFVECAACEFVLCAVSGEDPEPSRVDECPQCGGSEFSFL